MSWFRYKKGCPHVNIRGIYGDEILYGTPDCARLKCRDCGEFLSGPVDLATS